MRRQNSFSGLMALALLSLSSPSLASQKPLTSEEKARLQSACPDYSQYSKYDSHPPFSSGPLHLPFQRPAPECRTFESPLVEEIISDLTSRMIDKDLARIFENAFPNTLDTTVRWHVNGSTSSTARHKKLDSKWDGAQSFIVTGDINAEWLRDSTNQLAQYQSLAKRDTAIHALILGAINTQAEFVIASPYCNAFQPPSRSRLPPSNNGQSDRVHPAFEPHVVFECKWELDSLAHFLALSTQFHSATGSTEFITKRWLLALNTVLAVLDEQSQGTFDTKTGAFRRNEYTFQRDTNLGTETLAMAPGIGNPLAGGTGLVRSAFRPSDDATILGFFIPGNAMMAVQLKRVGVMLTALGHKELGLKLSRRGEVLRKAVLAHGVVRHRRHGEVFAFEVDGYGGAVLMDDANLPSLLALPLLGFVERDHRTYVNTRRMILDKAANPYYLVGTQFAGVGGPHIGPSHAWPMSVLVQIMTSEDDAEIVRLLDMVKRASPLGLVHESVNVNYLKDYTRSWFAWANSVFAQTVLDLAARKPHLLFGQGAKPYVVE